MKAFDKIQAIITNSPKNGHIMTNIKNIESLVKAKKEIEKIFKNIEKDEGKTCGF